MTNKELRAKSREQLMGSRGKFALFTVITFLLMLVIGYGCNKLKHGGDVISVIFGSVLNVIIYSVYLDFSRKGKFILKDKFTNWKAWLRYFLLSLIYGLIFFIICFIFLLLFGFGGLLSFFSTFNDTSAISSIVIEFMIIAGLTGIVIGVLYCIVELILFPAHYLIVDRIGFCEAVSSSWRLMKGNKWKLFKLVFSFIGWLMLSAVTLGIGFLWVVPYYNLTMTNFYLDIQDN